MYASTMANIVAAITFIWTLQFVYRLEKLEIRAVVGKAKVFGTIMGIRGTMLITF
ncbi:hypothetical protein ACOSQ4_004697 [Xanthoceras sorbifolium]